jgi:hypothetical protein
MKKVYSKKKEQKSEQELSAEKEKLQRIKLL